MDPKVTVTECPNCGAPLSSEAIEDPERPACPFCHSLLPVAAPPPPPSTAPAFTLNQSPPDFQQIRRKTRRVFRVSLLGTFLIVAVSVALPILLKSGSKGGGSAASYQVRGQVTAAPPSVGPDLAFVIAPKVSSAETAVLRLVNIKTHKILWSSPAVPIVNGADPAVVVAGADVIMVAGTDVMAFSAVTGNRIWQSSITNDLQIRPADEGLPGSTSDCLGGCAIVIGSDLITLAKDGTVQGFSVSSGAQLWSRRLADTPSFLQAAGGYAAIVSAPKPGADQLLMFNPATGAERAIAPACAPDQFGEQANPNEDGGFFISPAGNDLVVLTTGPGGCLASYSLPAGKVLWRTAPDPDNTAIPAALTGESAVGGGGYVSWTNEIKNDRWIFAASTATGQIRQLIDTGSQNQNTQLDGVVSGALVTEIAPSFASDQPGVYGISLKSGHQLWMLPSRVTAHTNDGHQSLVVTSTGIAILSCESAADDQSGSCKFEAVSPTTGVLQGTLNLVRLDPAPDVSALPGPGGEVLANVDSGLAVVFNPVSGDEEGQWPFLG